jgi:hypothetical protein
MLIRPGGDFDDNPDHRRQTARTQPVGSALWRGRGPCTAQTQVPRDNNVKGREQEPVDGLSGSAISCPTDHSALRPRIWSVRGEHRPINLTLSETFNCYAAVNVAEVQFSTYYVPLDPKQS